MGKGSFRATRSNIPVVGWPGILGDVAKLFGDEVTEIFARHYGDSKLYIPQVKHLRENHSLVMVLGIEKARILSEALGGSEHTVPTGRWSLSHHRVRIFRSKGWAVEAIAKATAIRFNTVARLCEGMEAPLSDPQPVTLRCHACDQLHTFDPVDLGEWRYDVIRPALAHPRGSAERSAALTEIARAARYPSGERSGELVSKRTLYTWIAEFEASGFAGLTRKVRSDRGKLRGQQRVRAGQEGID